MYLRIPLGCSHLLQRGNWIWVSRGVGYDRCTKIWVRGYAAAGGREALWRVWGYASRGRRPRRYHSHLICCDLERYEGMPRTVTGRPLGGYGGMLRAAFGIPFIPYPPCDPNPGHSVHSHQRGSGFFFFALGTKNFRFNSGK